jgi:hypothetical protein
MDKTREMLRERVKMADGERYYSFTEGQVGNMEPEA